jgi:WD40 repeat protein
MSGTVTALDWSADGRLAAVIGGSITIWRSLDDSNPYRLSTDARQLGRLRWSSHGHLAVTSDQLLYVWAPEQVSEKNSPPVALASYKAVALDWSPQSHLAAVGQRSDTREAELRIWALT